MPEARSLLPLLALPLLLAASDGPAPLSDKAMKELAGRTAGAPVSCVTMRRIQSTRIVDETAVIYKESSRRWYVNQLDRGRCALLQPNRVLITQRTTGQLCGNDLVTIAEQTSPITYGACGLGEFVPYTK
ncbi:MULTISPECIES: DUF6491 family protein [unclassified Sphingomonas]|uniref:DUF6491 family protein n=1 Tax=unclassified Sphingomonas TaxID=196159 RepID=UPI0006F62016|nr:MULTISPECIES: DUF6491 family protein [unclassified Sphingomonas]KQX25368.1 hypothetical protein ASD17_21425 [Sphingomonas sp. Root1294]KQY66360.1 hypothetical protein ASD39_11230 [Sphingomonas sp. Root50]KRB90325.1 hypothetical protein ASE22_15720 [Sphingomonas sp. Root720]